VPEREAFVDQTSDFILKDEFASYQSTTKLWLILFCKDFSPISSAYTMTCIWEVPVSDLPLGTVYSD
jgi:hypothetical protein